MRELKMMVRLLRASTKSQVMYRMDFVIGVIGTLFYNATFLASVAVITSRFREIGGFTAWEIVFLFALFELGHSFYGFFLRNMSSYFNRHVMDGTLDIYFLRPYGILTQLNGSKMDYTAFVDTFIGLACFVAAYVQLGLQWGMGQWLMLLVFVASGAFIEFALSIAMNSVTILFPNTRSLFGAFYQLVLISQRYPLSIFSHGFQALLTFVFPLGFMNYYPTLLLLDKPGGWAGYFAPVVAALFTWLGIGIFNRTINYYNSTGS